MAYKLFYESIETQNHALSRIPLVCSYSLVSYNFSLLWNRTLSIDHPLPFPITRKSSFLGNEDEDEMDTGMITPVATICISNGDLKKAVRPEWDNEVFVLNCLCYLQVLFLFLTWFYSFFYKEKLCKVTCLHLVSLRRSIVFPRDEVVDSGSLGYSLLWPMLVLMPISESSWRIPTGRRGG